MCFEKRGQGEGQKMKVSIQNFKYVKKTKVQPLTNLL